MKQFAVCEVLSSATQRGARRKEEEIVGGVAKSNHTVITGLTRRAEEQIQRTLRIRSGATWSFFMPHDSDEDDDDEDEHDDYKS